MSRRHFDNHPNTTNLFSTSETTNTPPLLPKPLPPSMATTTTEPTPESALIQKLMSAKKSSGKTYAQIANQTGLTNVYVVQLLRRQAQLKPDTAVAFQAAVPALDDELIDEMMVPPPLRSYPPNIIQDPAIYRLNEAVMHFGGSIKEIINEDFGDGIMSAIDFFCSVDKVQGVDGKDRVVITFDGKFLPFSEQRTEHMVSRLKL